MITYAYENLFKLDSQKKDIVITDGTVTNSGTSVVITGDTVRFTNSDIHFEDLSLLESLCTESVLHFGACESSEFKFTISSKVASLEGKVLHVWLYFNDDASTLFEVGTYKVASDIATASKTVRNITAYDLMFDVLNTDYTAWYNGLSDSINTVKKFRDAFFTHVGITQKSVTLVNDSMPVSIGEATAMTGAIILRSICEINGRFGHMTRNNLFDYVKLVQNIQGLYPAVDLYPSPTLYPRQPKSTPIGSSGNYVPPLRYESYEVPSITRLQIRRDQSDIGVVVGTSGTDYIVQGNFLTYGLNGTQMTTAATNLLGEITGVVFQPFSFSMRTNLCLEVGDAIRCNDDLTGVEGYMLYRCVTGIQAMFDEIRCSSDKDYSQNVNSVGYQFQALNGRTLVLKQDIDEVSATLTEQLDETQYGSYAWQTAQEIGAKVDETHGNQTSGFSWVLNSSGHTWYKDNEEVMKIDGDGLSVKGSITAGSTITGTDITGSSFSTSDSGSNKTTVIDDGSITIKKGNYAAAVIDLNWQTDDVNITAYAGYALAIGAGNGIQFNTADDIVMNTNYHGIYIGVNSSNTVNTEYVGIDGRTWVHVGANTPSVTIGNSASSSSTTIKGDTLTLDADTTYIGANSDISANPIYIGHGTSGGHTGSYVEINGYQVRLNGAVYINGSSPATIGDVDSHYRTTCYYDSQNKYYIKFDLEAFNRLQFYSQYSGQTVTLNDIIQACGL